MIETGSEGLLLELGPIQGFGEMTSTCCAFVLDWLAGSTDGPHWNREQATPRRSGERASLFSTPKSPSTSKPIAHMSNTLPITANFKLCMTVDSRWFTRGWTLQELIAPSDLIFYSGDWAEPGTELTLQSILAENRHRRRYSYWGERPRVCKRGKKDVLGFQSRNDKDRR